jgi:O-succinylbenzoate synthase
VKPTDRQRVLRFLGDPPAARTRDELVIMLTGISHPWDEDLDEADAAKVADAEEVLAEMVTLGNLSFEYGEDEDERFDLFGPPRSR